MPWMLSAQILLVAIFKHMLFFLFFFDPIPRSSLGCHMLDGQCSHRHRESACYRWMDNPSSIFFFVFSLLSWHGQSFSLSPPCFVSSEAKPWWGCCTKNNWILVRRLPGIGLWLYLTFGIFIFSHSLGLRHTRAIVLCSFLEDPSGQLASHVLALNKSSSCCFSSSWPHFSSNLTKQT